MRDGVGEEVLGKLADGAGIGFDGLGGGVYVGDPAG